MEFIFSFMKLRNVSDVQKKKKKTRETLAGRLKLPCILYEYYICFNDDGFIASKDKNRLFLPAENFRSNVACAHRDRSRNNS